MQTSFWIRKSLLCVKCELIDFEIMNDKMSIYVQ